MNSEYVHIINKYKLLQFSDVELYDSFIIEGESAVKFKKYTEDMLPPGKTVWVLCHEDK